MRNLAVISAGSVSNASDMEGTRKKQILSAQSGGGGGAVVLLTDGAVWVAQAESSAEMAEIAGGNGVLSITFMDNRCRL